MKNKLFLITVFLNSCFFTSACEFIKDAPPQDPPPNSNQTTRERPHQTQTPGYPQTQTAPYQTQTPGYPQTQTAPGGYPPQTNQIGAACQTDADCVLVNKDCCGCKNGGESIAIHRSQQSSYNSNLQRACLARGFQLCSPSFRCGQARCYNSQCVMTRQ